MEKGGERKRERDEFFFPAGFRERERESERVRRGKTKRFRLSSFFLLEAIKAAAAAAVAAAALIAERERDEGREAPRRGALRGGLGSFPPRTSPLSFSLSSLFALFLLDSRKKKKRRAFSPPTEEKTRDTEIDSFQL